MADAGYLTAMRIALPLLLPRAVAAWALTRLIVAAVPMSMGLDFGSMAASPIGVILLVGAVGLVDIRVRREELLWANLGVTSASLYGIYAAAAIVPELIVAVAT